MNRLMEKLHQIFGSHDEHPTITSPEERNQVRQALVDQRLRFERMGIIVNTRRAVVAPSDQHRRQGEHT